MKKLLPFIFLVLVLCDLGNAQTKYLWATAMTGGAKGFGTIVQGDSDGTNFHMVYSFDSTNGSAPLGKIAMANNGLIYGTTQQGDIADSCVLYSYDPATQTFTNIYAFMGQPQYGKQPFGLISANNGKLYGMATGGGAHNNGVIFSVDPANNSYTDVHDFDSLFTATPSALLLANDGNLYGVTMGHFGVVLFSFNPSNNSYALLHTINPSPTINSYNITLMQASNNKIYGIVSSFSDSRLFSYDLTSSICDSLHVFNTGIHGAPAGGLVEADNGKIYGMWASNNGIAQIFSYDFIMDSFTTVLYLDSLTGLDPSCDMSKLGSGKLVFSTSDGGVDRKGALLSFDVTTNTCTRMFDFDSTTGMSPVCDILEASAIINGIKTPIANATINLCPNPANNMLFVRNMDINAPYTITNVFGQEIMKGVTTGATQFIDISLLSGGMYLINGVKFVKE